MIVHFYLGKMTEKYRAVGLILLLLSCAYNNNLHSHAPDSHNAWYVCHSTPDPAECSYKLQNLEIVDAEPHKEPKKSTWCATYAKLLKNRSMTGLALLIVLLPVHLAMGTACLISEIFFKET